MMGEAVDVVDDTSSSQKNTVIGKRLKEEEEEVRIPPEIWEEIGKRVDNPLSVLHFRSSCNSWRTHLPPRSVFPIRIPSPPNFSDDDQVFHFFITENTVYSYKPSSENAPVAVVFESRDLNDKHHEAASFFASPLIPKFPNTLNMHNCSITPILTTYYIRLAMPKTTIASLENTMFVDKIVLISYDINTKKPTTMLNPNYYLPLEKEVDIVVYALMATRDLTFLSIRSMEWKPVKCDPTKSKFDDIIKYHNKVWVVDKDGGAYVIDSNSLIPTQVVRPPDEAIIDRGRKRFVEASTELYMLVPSEGLNQSNEIKVFKLKQGEWEQVKSVGDHIFFVASGYSFSTIADSKRLFSSWKNCVFLDGLSFCRDVGSRLGLSSKDYPLFRQMWISGPSFGVYSFDNEEGQGNVHSGFKHLSYKDLPQIFCYNIF